MCEIVIDETHFDLNSLCGICSFFCRLIWYCIVFYVSCYTFPSLPLLLRRLLLLFIHCVWHFGICFIFDIVCLHYVPLRSVSNMNPFSSISSIIWFFLALFGSDLFAFCLSCCHFFCIIRKPLKPAIPFQRVRSTMLWTRCLFITRSLSELITNVTLMHFLEWDMKWNNHLPHQNVVFFLLVLVLLYR